MTNKEVKNGIEKINLNELNNCIEAIRRNMISSTNYEFLEVQSRLMLQRIRPGNSKQIEPIVFFSREEAMSIILKFFESLDNKEWYEQAKGIILGQNKNIGINIFREEDITDFLEKNEDGIYKYTYGSNIEQNPNNHKALIRVLLNDEIRYVRNCIPNDKFTIQDVYNIVHETSHTFDLGNDKKSIQGRQLFAEITPYCFEKMLGDYLINNNIVNERIVDKVAQRRMKISIRRAREVCAKVNLIKLKEKEKTLTKENIKQILEQNGIQDPLYIQSMLRDVLENELSIDYDARYPIAELTVHKYMKMYKKDRKQAIENLSKYCEAIKKGDSSGEILNLVGCPVNKKEVEMVINDIIDDKSR